MGKENKRRHVVFVTPSLEGGGAETVARDLAGGFSRDRFCVTVIVFKQGGTTPQFLPIDTTFYNLGKKTKLDFFRLIIKAHRIFKKVRPDYIITFMPYASLIAIAAVFGVSKKSALIVTEHLSRTYALGRGLLWWARKRLLTLIYRRADCVVAVSQAMREEIVNIFGVANERTKTIANPIDIQKVERLAAEDAAHKFLSSEKPLLISVGRLTQQKRYDVLLGAMHKIAERQRVNLIILGKGPLRQTLQREVQRYALEDSVEFLGFQENPYQWMKKASVFVLSSEAEGFPVVLLEAMACGVPIVATNCPTGPAEIIRHERTGLLVPANDSVSLAESIQRVLDDGVLRQKMVQAAREDVQQFSLETIVQEYQQLLDLY